MDRVTEATVAAIRRHVPELGQPLPVAEFSYHSLPLCVIDSVFSMGVRYTNAKKAVRSWCASNDPEWPIHNANSRPAYTISDFLRSVGALQGIDLSKRFFGGNRQRTSSRSGILKADAVVAFAGALQDCGVENFDDLSDANRTADARASVRAIPGQRSGISFNYFLMLAGHEDKVKADRMICRFVADAAGLPKITPDDAMRAVLGACGVLAKEYASLTPRSLDRMIWGYQSSTAKRAPKRPKRSAADLEPPLTIEDARRRLAVAYGVTPDSVSIRIDGVSERHTARP